MLPSRGGSGLRPASIVKQCAFGRIKSAPTRRISSRQFSNGRVGQLSQTWNNGSPLRGQNSVLAKGGVTNAFSRSSGASRSLSFWPWATTKPQSVDTLPAEDPAAASSNSTSSTAVEASAIPDASASPPWEQPALAEQGVQQEIASQTTSPAWVDPIAQAVSPDSLLDINTSSILDMPEQIGYLKNLGLDFGWGPTSSVQWILEHTYIYTGMPWWGTIAVVAIGFRLIMFVPAMNAARHAAILSKMRSSPEFIEAQAEMTAASHGSQDPTELMRARLKMSAVARKSGASTLKSVLPPLTLIPFSFGMFRLLRSMATIPVPSLETGGLLWFVDLSVTDPFYILPMTSAVISGLMMSQMQKSNLHRTAATESLGKAMLYILTPVAFLCTMWLPAAVQWFFLCFSVSSVAQSTLTLNPAVRRYFELPPLPEKPMLPSVSNHNGLSAGGPQWQAPNAPRSKGLKGVIEGMSKDLDNMKSGAKDIASMGGLVPKADIKKAKDYEVRRAQEEKEKTLRRSEEQRRKRILRERERQQRP